jgi:hypothetical protein
MKISWITFAFVMALTPMVRAQKDSVTTKPTPTWAAGMYGSISAGYGLFADPFKNVSLVGASLPASGLVLGIDAGIVFRNRFGLRAVVEGISATDLRPKIQRTLEAANPGYKLTFLSGSTPNRNLLSHYAMGISYAIPRKRWCFQPELLVGSTAVSIESTYAQLKELGTHRAFFYEVKSGYQEYRSRTLTLGGRAAWYTWRYFGVFADARLLTIWNNFQYQYETTALLEETKFTETVRIKNTVMGATLMVGVFLQSARWEGKRGDFWKVLK